VEKVQPTRKVLFLLRPFSQTRLITFVKTNCIEFYENLKNSLVADARSQVDVQEECSVHIRRSFFDS
jgi:hypothetical protein